MSEKPMIGKCLNCDAKFELTNSAAMDIIRELIDLKAQLKTRDEVIELAVKALEKYKDAAFDIDGKIYAVGAPAKEAINKLNTLLGREKV